MLSNPENSSNLHQMFRRLLPVEPAHTSDLAWKFNSCEQRCSLILHNCQSNIRRGNKVLDWYNFARPALLKKALELKVNYCRYCPFWSLVGNCRQCGESGRIEHQQMVLYNSILTWARDWQGEGERWGEDVNYTKNPRPNPPDQYPVPIHRLFLHHHTY